MFIRKSIKKTMVSSDGRLSIFPNMAQLYFRPTLFRLINLLDLGWS